MKSTLSLAAAAAVALALPAGAQAAATISVPLPCAVASEPIPVTGTGFGPNEFILLRGEGVTGSGTTDAAGNLSTTLSTFISGNAPKTLTVAAEQDNVPVAQTQFSAVREPFMVDANLNGNPRSKITWKFAGFILRPGQPIFGHFRLNGRTVRNYRFGKPQGPCGVLSVRARRLPVRTIKRGTYRFRIDQRRSYSAKEPGRPGRLTIITTFRPR